jgi:hypothetical protein
MAVSGAVTNRTETPVPLLGPETMTRLWESSLVFAKHEPTHEHRAQHDDKTEQVKH